MKVIITGAEGYIGSVLCQELGLMGFDVSGIDTGYYRCGRLYDGLKYIPKIVPKDMRSVGMEDLKGADAVVHLAELSNDPLGQFNPETTKKINYYGSLQLAETAKKAGIGRFVYASSCSVYGLGDGDKIMDERSEVNPQTTYAECKVLVERKVAKLASGDFSPTFLRNATVFGPSPRMRFDLVLNNLCGVAYTTGEIRLTSDGTPWRPMVHILDVCDAVKAVLNADKEIVRNEIFNVGHTTENYQVREIAEIVSKTFSGCKLVMGEKSADNRSYRVSFDKIHKVLPQFSGVRTVEEGAIDLRDLFEEINLDRDTFEGRAFTRLKQLEYLVGAGQIDKEFFWRK